MKIREVIERTKAYCQGTMPDGTPIDDAKCRDQVLWGDVEQECTGIVTCIWPAADVIREAAARGANFIISHEAMFWNHGDRTDWLEEEGNHVFAAKRELLDEHGIAVWRFHDYIHSGIPSPDGDDRWVDGIFYGLSKELGWPVASVEEVSYRAVFMVNELDGRPASEFALQVIRALDSRGLRIIGDPATPVHRAGVALHMNGRTDVDQIRALDGGVDCLLACETLDSTTLEYVRDSCQVGIPKCVLSCGHFNIEEPGMMHMVEWLPKALGADGFDAGMLPVSYVKAGDHYEYLSA